MQQTVEVIDDPQSAAALLEPTRLRILERLREPDSAAGVARRLGLPRQRVGYHVRELERRGLVHHVADRRQGNFIERLVQATARRYVIAPQVLGALGASPEAVRDRLSSSYLVAVAAQTIREVAELRERADAAGKRLPTLSLQVDVRFATPAQQAGFAEELAARVAELAARYDAGPEGRRFRLAVLGHPALDSPNGVTAPGAQPREQDAAEDEKEGARDADSGPDREPATQPTAQTRLETSEGEPS